MRYRIEDIVDSISNKFDFSNKDKVIFLNTSDIAKGKILSHRYSKVIRLPGQAKKSIKNGDILFSEIRPSNKRYTYISNINDDEYVVSTKLMVLRNKRSDILNTKYFYFYLTSPTMLRYLQQEAESRSGTFPQITFKDNLGPIKIEIPSKEVQKKIVFKIEAIQNKINLNQQINENLESLMFEIFNHQIVNIKDGIKCSLTDIANYKNGLAMQKYRPQHNESGLPVLKIRELNQGFTDDSSDLCSSNINSDVKVNTGDIIFSWSGTLLVKLWTGQTSGLNQHLFKVTSSKYPNWFIYEWTKYYLQKFQEIAKDKATTMGHIKRSDLKNSQVIVPNPAKLAELNNVISPIYEKILEQIYENNSLINLKKQLLAKYF